MIIKFWWELLFVFQKWFVFFLVLILFVFSLRNTLVKLARKYNKLFWQISRGHNMSSIRTFNMWAKTFFFRFLHSICFMALLRCIFTGSRNFFGSSWARQIIWISTHLYHLWTEKSTQTYPHMNPSRRMTQKRHRRSNQMHMRWTGVS